MDDRWSRPPVVRRYFDDLGTSLFTLFQIMTGENSPDTARSVMEQRPVAWIFFVVYIVVSTWGLIVAGRGA